jgi:hypothetical protein
LACLILEDKRIERVKDKLQMFGFYLATIRCVENDCDKH